MPSPTITALSTTIGPANQWIYMFGTDFVPEQTNVYFNSLDCGKAYVFNPTQLGFYLPQDASGTGVFKVVTPEGEFTSDIEYTVATPTQPPTVIAVRDHPDPTSKWVYVDGTEFVSGQTTVTYECNGTKTVDVFIYTTTAGGFAKIDIDDVITSISLSTPNGSCEFTCAPAIT